MSWNEHEARNDEQAMLASSKDASSRVRFFWKRLVERVSILPSSFVLLAPLHLFGRPSPQIECNSAIAVQDKIRYYVPAS